MFYRMFGRTGPFATGGFYTLAHKHASAFFLFLPLCAFYLLAFLLSCSLPQRCDPPDSGPLAQAESDITNLVSARDQQVGAADVDVEMDSRPSEGSIDDQAKKNGSDAHALDSDAAARYSFAVK